MTSFKPEFGFSVANITTEARNVNDFGDDGFSGLYGERMEVVIPNPTRADRESYDLPKRGEWDDSDRADEFRDSFFPLMNSIWPVELAYGRSEQEAADLMNRHGGATTLITIDGDHYIAMTGGGMDLSWHLAAAYVCCGCVPPVELLRSIGSSPFGVSPSVTRAILSAGRRGAAHLSRVVKNVREDLRALSKARVRKSL